MNNRALFCETTALIVLRFHIQHDQTVGLQNDKIQPVENSRWPLILKTAKPFLQNSLVYLVKILHETLVRPWYFELSSAVELSHSDRSQFMLPWHNLHGP